MQQPNIIYLHSHDTGRYVQPYGYAVPTPHIQRLAEEGILFRQAFCAAPTCSPSRAALLTGQCAHSSGMLGLAHRGFTLNDYSQHIIHTLHRVGYTSALAGIQHLSTDPKQIGYDDLLPSADRGVRTVAPAAVAYLDNAPSQPFFLSVGFFETHRYQQGKLGYFTDPGPRGDSRYVRPPAPLPDTAETRADMADFIQSAGLLDDGIGAILDALDRNHLADNTLVICTTDHGPPFPYMKCNLTDHGMGVMLILRGPGGFSGGQAVDALVSQIDIFPTICDLIDIEHPAWLQGESLLPFVKGTSTGIHDAIYAEVNYHGAYRPIRAVRTQRWKYVRRYDDTFPICCDGGPSKDLWVAHGWEEHPVIMEALYDLVFDPNETNNVLLEPGLESVRQEMQARLDRWMQATDDPLLHGPVPAPAHANVQRPPV
jgi:N-sulfoglucosamine sulfohydrolase